MNRQLRLRVRPRYGVITLTLPCHEDYVEVGPVLAASYDRQVFEILYPFRVVLRPIDYDIVETFGPLDTPLQAYQRYEGWQAEHQEPPLQERAVGEGWA